MAQQPQNSLAVVNIGDAALVPLSAPSVKSLVDRYLVGSKFKADDLLLDMASQMTLNPKLRQCSAQSLYGVLIFTAKHQLSFGVGGVWIVPRNLKEGESENKVLTAMPQLDYRAMETIAQLRHGLVPPVTIQRVYPGEKAEIVLERGMPVDIKHTINPAQDRSQINFLWAYLVAHLTDGRYFIYTMDRASLEKRRQTSTARDGDAWKNWAVEMYDKTLERKAMQVLCKDFTVGLAGGDAAFADEGEGQPLDITEESKRLTQSEQLKRDLAPKSAATEKPASSGQTAAPPTSPTAAGQDSPAPAEEEAVFGLPEAKLVEIENGLADIALGIANKNGEKKAQEKGVMDHWKANFKTWEAACTAEQIERLVKARDGLIAEIKKQ